MAERRPLAAAVNSFAGADPAEVRAFVTQERRSDPSEHKAKYAANTMHGVQTPVSRKQSRLQPVGLIPITIRLRPEIAGALKRASLERQLRGEDVFTQQQLVENVLEPWLIDEGYIAGRD